MQRIAFKMQLNKGCEAEYERRHRNLWPELQLLLKAAGISDYSIFLDDTGALFGVLTVQDPAALDTLSNHPVMHKWWTYMADIMTTHADNSPQQTSLTEVFYLP